MVSIILIGLLVISGVGASAISLKNPVKSTSISEYDLVIIAPDMFSDALQPFIDHKNSVGVQTFLKTTEDIYDEFTGRDQAEQIKYFIKNVIEKQSTRYILFVGDKNLIPMREIIVSIRPVGLNNLAFYTDNYFADIYDSDGSFCSWNDDDDQRWGEAIAYAIDNITFIDHMNLYPDIGVGRLPCKNVIEVKILINKIITYETKTYGRYWFNRIILMAGDTFPTIWEIIEGEVITEKISQLMVPYGFEPIRLYTSNNTFKPYRINLEISKGAGFVSFSGHGNSFGVSTYPPFNENSINYDYRHIFGQFNFNKLPIVFLFACSTADPDGFSWNEHNFDCFAWSLVKKIFGGAIASIGQTTMGYLEVMDGEIVLGGDLLQLYFFESYEERSVLSDMMMSAQTKYLDRIGFDFLSVNEFILYGDPSLKIGGYPSAS